MYLPKLATNTNSDGGYTDGKSNGTAAAQQARRSISFNHIFEWLQSRGVKKIIKIVVVGEALANREVEIRVHCSP